MILNVEAVARCAGRGGRSGATQKRKRPARDTERRILKPEAATPPAGADIERPRAEFAAKIAGIASRLPAVPEWDESLAERFARDPTDPDVRAAMQALGALNA